MGGCEVERSGRRQRKRKQTKRLRGNRPGVHWWWVRVRGGEGRGGQTQAISTAIQTTAQHSSMATERAGRRCDESQSRHHKNTEGICQTSLRGN